MSKSEKTSRAIELDAELAHAAGSGDKIAWDRLVATYGGLVRSVVKDYISCLTTTPTNKEIHSLVKAVFRQIISNDFAMLKRFKRGSTLDTYLATEAARHVQNYMQAEREKGRFGNLAVDSYGMLWCLNDKERAIEAKGLKATVEDALSTLEPDQAVVFRLFYFQGIEYEDIATLLHMNIAMVTRTLKSARDNMAKLLTTAGHRIDEIIY